MTQIFAFFSTVFRSMVYFTVNIKGVNLIDLQLTRMFIAIFLSLAIIKVKKIPMKVPKAGSWTMIFAVFGTVASFGLGGLALTMVNVTVFTAVASTAIFINALFGWIGNGDRMSPIEIVAMFGCVAGVILISLSKSEAEKDLIIAETGEQYDLTSVQ